MMSKATMTTWSTRWVTPLAPLPDDQPVLDAYPEEEVYCTSCHQNVLVIRFNVCPACNCTDSTLPLTHHLARMCRESEMVNGQVILGVTLKQAIARNTRDRILDRMKKEPHEELRRPPHRYAGLADSDNLIFSRMPPSAPGRPPLAPAEDDDEVMAEPVGILNDDDILPEEEDLRGIDELSAPVGAILPPLSLRTPTSEAPLQRKALSILLLS